MRVILSRADGEGPRRRSSASALDYPSTSCHACLLEGDAICVGEVLQRASPDDMGCRGGELNTNLDNMNNNPKIIENKVQLIKIAIDMHLKSYRVVRQLDHSMVQPAQRFEPRRFYPWLAKQKKKAERIAVCYEAGCFGYEPARRMQAMGVEVYVIAPQ